MSGLYTIMGRQLSLTIQTLNLLAAASGSGRRGEVNALLIFGLVWGGAVVGFCLYHILFVWIPKREGWG